MSVTIAPRQREELDFLRETLDTVDRTVDRRSRADFKELRDRLDAWAARVAVIGQVKAGKSTFLNAFLGQHDFLPSDINPWTSVVTNIRVNLPGDPATGASFRFFDESDWEEIINGGSRIRKLTEELLPGFDTELLRRQSEEMRDRAQKRLGRHYHTLLGTTHDYDFLSADLLKRYVCAGPGSDDGLMRESLGRYAAITKVADAYMRLPEFAAPTIITDTPGVNDPFLVRDEFTCRSLDKSDVFVVVLSAHQALTEVDIALIRILAKQDSKDVVIFVNRIDELDDYAADVPRILRDVSARLRMAIPDIEFRILPGSGWMADLTLRDDPEAEALRAELDDDRLATYLRARHGHVPAEREERLRLASGLGEIRAVLSEVIDTGVGHRQLARLQEDIRARIGGSQFATRRERDSLQMQVQSVSSEVAGAAAAELEEEIAGIGAIQSKIEAQVESADGQVEKLLARAWSKLEGQLLGEIETFVDGCREAFHDRVARDGIAGTRSRSFDIDLTPLHLRLESEVATSYDRSRASIDVVLANCLGACRQAIRERYDDPTERITLDALPHDSFTSTLTLAKKSLRVEMIADRSWAFWRRPEVNVEKSVAALRAIAVAEMRPSVEKILSAFNEAQSERAEAGTDRVRVMQEMIEGSLAERNRRLKLSKTEMEEISRDPEVRRRLVERIQSKMEVLERRLLDLSALDSALTRTEPAKAA